MAQTRNPDGLKGTDTKSHRGHHVNLTASRLNNKLNQPRNNKDKTQAIFVQLYFYQYFINTL